jgi:DNA-binding LacI/PurR family transcriptional regulator
MVGLLDRLKGYQKSLKDANIAPDEQLVWGGSTNTHGTSGIDLGRQGAHYLLSLSNPPSAIIAINDMHAFGVYAGARDLGLNIPDDLSVTGLDDIAFTKVVVPSLTTIQPPIREIARLMVERLIGRLEDGSPQAPVHMMLPPKLLVRESTGKFIE